MKFMTYLLALLLFFAFARTYIPAGQGQTAPKTVYEYKVVFDANANNVKKLNELGAEGWELVAIRTVVFQGGDTGGHYYFKRAR